MNLFEARLLLMCQGRALTTSQLIANLADARTELGADVSTDYKYVNLKLVKLYLHDFMVREKKIVRGKAEKVTYYRSTQAGMEEAVAFLKKAGDEEAGKRRKLEEASRKTRNVLLIGSFLPPATS